MPKPKKMAPEPKYASQKRKCRYCQVQFNTKPTYNGSKQEFCTPQHRWAYQKEGRKPIAAILKRQEKHMRQIAREEAQQEVAAALDRFATITMLQVLPKLLERYFPASIQQGPYVKTELAAPSWNPSPTSSWTSQK